MFRDHVDVLCSVQFNALHFLYLVLKSLKLTFIKPAETQAVHPLQIQVTQLNPQQLFSLKAQNAPGMWL